MSAAHAGDVLAITLLAALASAATFGLSTSLQHSVTSRLDDTSAPRLLLTLLRTPVWALGMSLSVAAFALHAVALGHGSLVVVQPVIVTGVVFAVLIRAALDRRLPSRAELGLALVTWAGLAAFLMGAGSPDRAAVAPGGAPVAVLVLAGLAALGGLLARRLPARTVGKGLWLGATAGVLYGTVAVLLTVVLQSVHAGGLSGALLGWPVWAMVACGVAAVLVNQRAYQASRLSVSMPLLNIVDVLVAFSYAALLLGEVPPTGAAHAAAMLAGLGAITLGVVRLARLEDPAAPAATVEGRVEELVADPGLRAVVVVPTYDEAEGITSFLDGLLAAAPGVDVLVVDDNSPDGTGDLVADHPEHGRRLRLLSRAGKEGLGAAYRAGFTTALADGYDAIVQMDADGSHPVDQVAPMLARLRTHDLVIGSRYVPGGATRNWPLRRRVLSHGANLYARTVLGLRTHDATAGFRAWRRSALDRAGVLRSEADGYGFQVENTWHAEGVGLRVAEHPITFVEREVGASKMNPAIAREAVVLIARWRLASLTGARPRARVAVEVR